MGGAYGNQVAGVGPLAAAEYPGREATITAKLNDTGLQVVAVGLVPAGSIGEARCMPIASLSRAGSKGF